jgi:flagellar protein FlgJ
MLKSSVVPSFALGRHETRLAALRGGPGARERDQARLRETAREFEAIMLELMVKEMRKNVPESPIFGENPGREIFNEMLDGEYVRSMAVQGRFGIADLLVNQFGGK